jgi:hypothetical protein
VVRTILLLLTLIVAARVGAQTQQDHADDATTWGSDNNTPVVSAAQSADPTTTVPGYSGITTPLVDYYDQQSTGDLEADGINAVIVPTDPTVEYAWDQSNTPILEFAETDPLLVDSWAIQNNTAVVEGELVLTGTDCVDGDVVTPETTIERCSAWTLPEEAFCDDALDVTVEVNPRTYTAVVRVINDVGRLTGVTTLGGFIPLNDAGIVVDYGIGDNGEYIGFIRVVDGMDVGAGFDCSSVTDVSVDVNGTFISVDPPRCFGGRWSTEILYNSGPRNGGLITYTVTAGAAPTYTDAWTDGCPALMAECETQGPPICIEGPEERLITANTGDAYPVWRDCWRTRMPLMCAGSVMTNTGYCDELVARGCSPRDSVCIDGTCEHSYECPVDGWSEPAADCSDTTFGLSGIVFDTSVDPSTDFGEAAANLQAMEEAVLDLDSGGVTCTESPPGSGEYDCVGDLLIFNGEDKRCEKKALGFSNCCSRSGWGLGWADSCDPQEEQLRVRREQGQCHYVGTYCSEDTLFGCLAKKETHCCFRSKLGRIIHEQGRPQLSILWGTAEAPECGGFSSEQLAALDFGAIDFSEYFADAFGNVTGGPDNTTMESIIDAYITTLSGASTAGCSQFDPGFPDC